jgi:hypothetical protein
MKKPRPHRQRGPSALNSPVSATILPTLSLVPVEPDTSPTADDPIFRLHELAESIGPLTNAEIDRTVYGE